MRTNYKALKLVEKGLSAKVVYKLNESQIDKLYHELISELTIKNKPSYSLTDDEARKGAELPPAKPGQSMLVKKTTSGIEITPNESEITERKKKKKINPWAICTSSLSKEFGTSERSEWSKKQMAKYERCVQDVKDSSKKNLKETKDELSLFIESQIMKIVEKHIPARITKRDLLEFVTSAEPAVAPPKEKEKEKTIPLDPRKRPGKLPAPKASKEKQIELLKLIRNAIENEN